MTDRTNRRRAATALGIAGIAGILAAPACAALALDDDGWSRAIADHIAGNLERVDRTDGILVERGTVPGDPDAEVVSRVRFAAPGDVIVEVQSPEAYRGDVFAHVGSTVHIVSRRLRAGIRIRNVPALDAAGRRRLIRASVAHDLRTYAFDEEPPEEVAGRRAVPWTVTPFEDGDMRLRSRTHADADLSFALRTVLFAPGEAKRPLYRMKWRELRVNEAVPEGELAYRPPEGIAFIDWDMASAPLSLERARAAADFDLLRAPADAKLARTRIVASERAHPPMLCLVYEKPPFYATVTQTRDRDLRDPKARGVPWSLGDVEASVLFGGAGTTTVSFVRDGTDVTITSNLPLDELIAFARTLRKR